MIEIFAVIAPQAVIAVDCAQLAAAVGPASLLAGREVVSFSASLPISAATPDRSIVVVYAPPGTLPAFNDPSIKPQRRFDPRTGKWQPAGSPTPDPALDWLYVFHRRP